MMLGKPGVVYFSTTPDGRLFALVYYACQIWWCHDYLLRRTGNNSWTHDTTGAFFSFAPPAAAAGGVVYSIGPGKVVRQTVDSTDSIPTTSMMTSVTALAVSPQGRLFTLNSGGLAYVMGDTGWWHFDFGLPEGGASALAFDTVGNVFAATPKGVYINRTFAHSSAVRPRMHGRAPASATTIALRRYGPELSLTRPGDVAVTLLNQQGRTIQHYALRRYEAGRHALGSGNGPMPCGMYITEVVFRDAETGEGRVERTRAVVPR
jgi:hypothetical protein